MCYDPEHAILDCEDCSGQGLKAVLCDKKPWIYFEPFWQELGSQKDHCPKHSEAEANSEE